MTSNDTFLCNECNNIFNKLQKNCIRLETRVEASKKLKTRHDLSLSSPLLAKNK